MELIVKREESQTPCSKGIRALESGINYTRKTKSISPDSRASWGRLRWWPTWTTNNKGKQTHIKSAKGVNNSKIIRGCEALFMILDTRIAVFHALLSKDNSLGVFHTFKYPFTTSSHIRFGWPCPSSKNFRLLGSCYAPAHGLGTWISDFHQLLSKDNSLGVFHPFNFLFYHLLRFLT
jgi:hypothetical protein